MQMHEYVTWSQRGGDVHFDGRKLGVDVLDLHKLVAEPGHHFLLGGWQTGTWRECQK